MTTSRTGDRRPVSEYAWAVGIALLIVLVVVAVAAATYSQLPRPAWSCTPKRSMCVAQMGEREAPPCEPERVTTTAGTIQVECRQEGR